MKLNFSKSVPRLWGKVPLFLLGLLLSPLMAIATSSSYTNTATISGIPPTVDATNFYNYGTWDIFTTKPYQTFDTQNYVNEGTMIGSVGWEFDYGSSTGGGRTMATSFFNDFPGLIEASDSYIDNPPNNPYPNLASYLLISAANITNYGTLIAGTSGEMLLTGSNVMLTRSTLQIGSALGSNSIPSQCSENNVSQTNFTADASIYDEYWVTNNVTIDSLALWNGTNATSPLFGVDAYSAGCTLVSNILAPSGQDPFTFASSPPNSILADSISLTNPPGATGTNITQIFRQAVFVLSNTNIFKASDSFYGYNTNTGNYSNLFQIITVRLTTTNTGPLFLSDLLGSASSNSILLNANATPGFNPLNSCAGPTYRPANYILERSDCQDYFALGTNGAGPPSGTGFFYAPPGASGGFSNQFVQAGDAAYSAYIDDLAQNPFGASLTNLPGRIVINAGNLDLTRTTISSQGPLIMIQATNLLGSAGAVVSCQNMSYNIGSTSGNLNVTNLANSSTVPGLHGSLYAWSALWTNGMTVIANPGTTNAVTNTIPVNFHVLFVDATKLTNIVPVALQDLDLHSTNMIVSDSFSNVASSLLFDGRSLTLQGALALSGNIQNWNSSIAPSLLYFTNNGTLTIFQDAHFGDDVPTNYAAFVNNGTGTINVGGGETINSAYYQEEGTETAASGFSVTASTGLVENAAILSGQYINLVGGTFQLRSSEIFAQNALNFSVTNSLSDNGSANILVCGKGFNLFVSPQSGNLSASTITDNAPGNYVIGHAWAGSDLGGGATGTSDNLAIGTLALVAQKPSQLPTFHFSGTTGNNAMYVNTLNLTGLGATAANLTSFIQIDPGMKIYFANVQPALLSGQSTATVLQNQFPGQFIQDANAGQSAGGGSSSNIVISSITPITSDTISSGPTNSGITGFVLTWNSTSGATYSVLKTNTFSVPTANWPAVVKGYPPSGAVGGPLSYTDTTTIMSPTYYRVRSP
ncbi:MAG TPA: hypothetical protein VMA35_09500 [Candidatus Sulfopaludibacter sp.]|nr:hypothetical protein [Candidatus Sulfopaludibacter sp.]